MQPTYLPWCGYFALMACVDTFIILDNVQFSRRSWQHRNKIKSPNGELMLTVPIISKGLRDQKIIDTQIDLSTNFYKNHIKSIEQNYKKTRFYINYSKYFNDILMKTYSSLVELNLELIYEIKDILKINTNLVRSSNLKSVGVKDELLFALCNEVGASHYISPIGSSGYLEDSKVFKDSKISYSYFLYNHPQYSQPFGSFIPYMSSIDLIFNEGERSLDIIKSGIKK